MKYARLSIVLLLVLAACVTTPEQSPEPVIVARADPQYPIAAAEDEVEGVITLAFNIAYNGRPRNIRVVDADPPGYFEEAAIEAMSRWRFDANQRSYSYEHEFTQTFEFELDPDFEIVEADGPPQPLERVQPRYPREAASNGVNGHVVMEFVLAPDGRVRSVEVVESEPEGVFEKAALSAMKQWRYPPPDEEWLGRRLRQEMTFTVTEVDKEG